MLAPLKRACGLLLRLIAVALIGIGANAAAADCEKLLVADFALPGLDTTTDLAYLATITPENFALHKTNATPKMKHLGVLLPIASDLLQHANGYEEFSRRRAQKTSELGFDYPAADLAAYYRRLLPADRLSAYNACTGVSGFVAQVVKADRDFVVMMLSWRASAGAPTQAPVQQFAVTGAVLIGAVPAALQAQPARLVFSRNLDSDLRFSASVAAQPVAVWVPRFVGAPVFAEPADAACADAGKVVRALYRQLLGRDAKPAELATQTALLKERTNSVRQLAERLVLSDEYQKKFAGGAELDVTLQALYAHVLAREGDAKGLAANKAHLRNAGFAAAAITYFENAEYQRRFGAWTVPGAPPAARYCAPSK